jgi:hypothetical protein
VFVIFIVYRFFCAFWRHIPVVICFFLYWYKLTHFSCFCYLNLHFMNISFSCLCRSFFLLVKRILNRGSSIKWNNWNFNIRRTKLLNDQRHQREYPVKIFEGSCCLTWNHFSSDFVIFHKEISFISRIDRRFNWSY